MAWEVGEVDNTDLLGMHGDDLFADPVGARSAKGKTGGRPTPQQAGGRRQDPASRLGRPGPTADSGGSMDRSYDGRQAAPLKESEEEEPGMIRQFFGSIFGMGTECCSMRDRTKDAEAAKEAGKTGRPPQSLFPAPRAPVPPPPEPPQQRQRKDVDAEPDDLEETRVAGRRNPQRPFAVDEAPEDKTWGGGRNVVPPHIPEEPSRAAAPPPRSAPPPRQASPERAPERAAPPPPNREAERERVAPGTMPKRWAWPAWSLNSKNPVIEVFVTDDDSGEKRWCEAEPQFRVVDKEGNDAYLCAEYEWDGEYYVQDFGPQHVRRRGQDMTVQMLFANDPDAIKEEDYPQDATAQVGRRPADLEQTTDDPFLTLPNGGKRQADTGGGVRDWMDQ